MTYITDKELCDIANGQKAVIWLIPFSLAAILVPFFGQIVMGIFSLIFVYKLAVALKSKVAWLWCILMFIPIISMISLCILNGKATSVLKNAGIKVGLMGANKKQMEKVLQNADIKGD